MAIDVQIPPDSSISAPVNGAAANDGPRPLEPSVTFLVSGIIADLQQLIQQQLAMVRQEIRDDLRKTLVGLLRPGGQRRDRRRRDPDICGGQEIPVL